MFASADTYRHLSAYEYARPLHHINTKSARRKDQCLELDASWQLGALKILAPEDVPNSTKFDVLVESWRRVGGELVDSVRRAAKRRSVACEQLLTLSVLEHQLPFGQLEKRPQTKPAYTSFNIFNCRLETMCT